MSTSEPTGFTPLFPKYSEVKQLLPILVGIPKSHVTSLTSELIRISGTPQQPLDWTNPDEWIPRRLRGNDRELAMRVWSESNRVVNPRHMRGSYYFINRRGLLGTDSAGIYYPSERYAAFLEDDPHILGQVDAEEGIPQLLGILATRTSAKFGELMPEWTDFTKSVSNYKSESAIRSLLRFRLGNLIERELITREGSTYTIASAGIEMAKDEAAAVSGESSPLMAVSKAIREFNTEQVSLLRSLLLNMKPYKFEHLIRDLLEAMGYEDVVVTRESGDRGVDVVATVQFGITTITEVVQVKRFQGTIGRPTIDQLRGALPYHNAIRGTIITTGTFSSGCAEAALFLGAAPISLIDGHRLEELLVEHEIGIRKRQTPLFEVDTNLFSDDDDELANGELLSTVD
jgi:restriction system protein